MSNWLQNVFTKLRPSPPDPAQALANSNLARYGVPSAPSYDLTAPARELSAVEIRELALGGILAYWNKDPFYQLPPPRPEYVADKTQSIIEWWGIGSAAQAHAQLQDLLESGHRVTMRQQLKEESQRWQQLFRQNPFLAQRQVLNIAAWDYGRIVPLARWCYDLGYLSWDEARGYLQAANRLASAEYYSWESFATGFLAGRIMWNPRLESHAEVATIATFLLTSPLSPWRKLAW